MRGASRHTASREPSRSAEHDRRFLYHRSSNLFRSWMVRSSFKRNRAIVSASVTMSAVVHGCSDPLHRRVWRASLLPGAIAACAHCKHSIHLVYEVTLALCLHPGVLHRISCAKRPVDFLGSRSRSSVACSRDTVAIVPSVWCDHLGSSITKPAC